MKYLSPLISEARNKLGGTVFARNRSGNYSRAKVNPTQPRTTSQNDNRANFAALSSSWKTLTQSQIQGWNQAAEAITLKDSLGQSYMPTGLQLYVSCNRNRGFIGSDPLTNAPQTKPPIGAYAGLNFTFYPGTYPDGGFIFPEPATFTADPSALVISATGQLSNGINFVANHLYRRLVAPYIFGSGFVTVTTPYTSIYGSFPASGKIGIKIVSIDRATGYAGAAITYLETIG